MLPGFSLDRGQPVRRNECAGFPVIPRNAPPSLPLDKLDRALPANAADTADLRIGEPTPFPGTFPTLFGGELLSAAQLLRKAEKPGPQRIWARGAFFEG